MKNTTRRQFLSSSAALGTVSWLGGAESPRPVVPGSPNGDVRIGIVGLNGKGGHHIQVFLTVPGAKIVALCDVDQQVLARRAQELGKVGVKVAAYSDYRRLLEDASIDAVVIATPNHWHALMAIWACQAGKDVYVEKPVSHNVWEGRKIVEAAAKYGRVVQVGTQSRSDPALAEAFAGIRSGRLGRIQWVRGFCYKQRASIGRTSGPQPVSETVDYDLWTGPAPLVPLRRNSKGSGSVHYNWHWFWHYGGGDLANQGIHEMDMCRWALGESGLPAAVRSFGGRFGYVDDAETPNTQVTVLNYGSAPLIFEVRGLPTKSGMKAMDAYRGVRVGLVVQCEHGYFAGGAGGGAYYESEGKKIQSFSGPGGGGHQANFIAAMHSRKSADLAAPIEGGHISSALCHLGNISFRLGKELRHSEVRSEFAADSLQMDSLGRMLEHLTANGVDVERVSTVVGPVLDLAPGTEAFVSRKKYDLGFWANTMLRRDYRPPFVVPERV